MSVFDIGDKGHKARNVDWIFLRRTTTPPDEKRGIILAGNHKHVIGVLINVVHSVLFDGRLNGWVNAMLHFKFKATAQGGSRQLATILFRSATRYNSI